MVRAPNADLSRDPRWGTDGGVVWGRSVPGGDADGGVCAGLAGAGSEALAGGVADEAFSWPMRTRMGGRIRLRILMSGCFASTTRCRFAWDLRRVGRGR